MMKLENLLNLNYEGQKIRSFNINGEFYALGTDVARVLGYTDLDQAVRVHVEEDDKKILSYKASVELTESIKSVLWSNNDFSNKTIINEPGVYSLIFGSKLESSKEFKKWIRKEVLPSIRKTGSYSVNNKIQIINTVDPEQWRKELVSIVRGISSLKCKQEHIMYGKSIAYCWDELKKNVNEELNINVKSRVTRTRNRMIKQGSSKTKANQFGITHLLSQDKNTIESVSKIILKMMNKYQYELTLTENTNFKIILDKELSKVELERQELINNTKLLKIS